MVRVACTVMLKDERDLIDPFLTYHSALFGTENMYIIDNGSKDPCVLETLKKFQSKGASVDYSHQSPEDYKNKGEIISSLVKALDAKGMHDLYVLLDCDEFVILSKESSYSCKPEEILKYLELCVGASKILRVNENLSNVPGHAGLFRAAPYAKTIFPKDILVSTDHGHHLGIGRYGSERLSCDIVYVHYHYRSYNEVVKFARQKLSSRMTEEELNDPVKLKSYRGRGWHMVGYLLGSEEEYYSQFETSSKWVLFPELMQRFKDLNISIPFSNHTSPQISKRRYMIFIDEITTDRVRGWVVDMWKQMESAYLRFKVNNKPIWEGRCTDVRLDVRKSGRPIENVGFDIVIPSRTTPERVLVLSIEDADENSVVFRYKGLIRSTVEIQTEFSRG